MLKLLLEPYPHAETYTRSTIVALLTGLFVACFLMYFQPFGIAEWQHPYKYWLLSGYGWITFFAMCVTSLLLPKVFPSYFLETDWTILKEILLITSTILLIAIGNISYSLGANLWMMSNETVGRMFSETIVLGVFPAVVIVLINYIYHLKLYHIHEKNIAIRPLVTNSILQEEILVAENEKDKITLASSDLMYIESSDNYSTVYFIQEEKLQKMILRSSLSRLEQQINDKDNIVRCHRSYIINLQQVRAVSGNAQGYKFHLALDNIQIPVARKNTALVERFK